jgi:hypothetical protein
VLECEAAERQVAATNVGWNGNRYDRVVVATTTKRGSSLTRATNGAGDGVLEYVSDRSDVSRPPPTGTRVRCGGHESPLENGSTPPNASSAVNR